MFTLNTSLGARLHSRACGRDRPSDAGVHVSKHAISIEGRYDRFHCSIRRAENRGGCWFRDFRPPLESITTAHQVNGLSTSPLRSDQGRQGYAGTGSVAGSGRVLGVLLAYANRGSGRPLRIDMSGRAQGHLLGRRGVHWEQVGCDSAPVSALLVEMGTMLLVRAEWRYPRSRSPPRLRGHRCRAPTTNAWRS